MLWGLLITGQHPEGQGLVAGPRDPVGGDDAHAVGMEQQHRQPLCGRQRLHPRVESLLAVGILGLSGNQDDREIQLVDEVQQEIQLMVLREPLAWRRRQLCGLLRLPGSKGLALLQAPLSRPDPLQS